MTRERFKNKKFKQERIGLDGKEFEWCEFKDCLIVLQKGDTVLERCSFDDCRLMLQGNAYTVGKIIKLFTPQGPLKVLDLKEPIFDPSGTDKGDLG
jgi:hypothetical protein